MILWNRKLFQRFPCWLCRVIRHLGPSWNTKIMAATKNSLLLESSGVFLKVTPTPSVLVSFTLCLNPATWSPKSTDGSMLSRHIGTNITHPLLVDDLKVYASCEAKLKTVFNIYQLCDAVNWNPKKCNVIHVKRRSQVHDAADIKLDQTTVVKSLKAEPIYKFLRVVRDQVKG